MVSSLQIAAVIVAGLAVAVADALIKKAALASGFVNSLKSPLMILILLLYLVQIVFFAYVFVQGWELGIVGNLQMVFYSIAVVTMGIIFFSESLGIVQIVGVILALIGVVLMNL